MSIEIPKNNSTELQALVMAKDTGIELTPVQISLYVQLRLGNFSGQMPKDFTAPFNLSDQRLLDELLTPEQRPIFRLHYPNIFQPYNK